MNDLVRCVAETRHLRLYKLVQTSQPWSLYLLEGSTPEPIAMLQALYSRSGMGIEERFREITNNKPRSPSERLTELSAALMHKLEHMLGLGAGDVAKLDSGRQAALVDALELIGNELVTSSEEESRAQVAQFMEMYYVNYGHKSIGDCGAFVLIFEGVPLHLPTQIQDSALYSGQERSTRYQDMSAGRLWNPLENALGETIMRGWMAFYVRAFAEMETAYQSAFPFIPTEGDSEKTTKQKRGIHTRAVRARAFDIARGFLLVGASTSGTWSVNLRQASDHLRQLMQHPDPLVRQLASDLFTLLKTHYQNSFAYEGREETRTWLRHAILFATRVRGAKTTEVYVRRERSQRHFRGATDILKTRPERTDIPRHLRNIAEVRVHGQIDFASFRDIHRHRACDMPVACIEWNRGFHPWYLKMLTTELRKDARKLLKTQKRRFDRLKGDPFLKQCCAPIGAYMPFTLWGSLGAVIYLIELRSKNDVHPTVRRLVWDIGDGMTRAVPEIPITIDRTPDRFNLKRGEQTILRRSSASTDTHAESTI